MLVYQRVETPGFWETSAALRCRLGKSLPRIEYSHRLLPGGRPGSPAMSTAVIDTGRSTTIGTITAWHFQFFWRICFQICSYRQGQFLEAQENRTWSWKSSIYFEDFPTKNCVDVGVRSFITKSPWTNPSGLPSLDWHEKVWRLHMTNQHHTSVYPDI